MTAVCITTYNHEQFIAQAIQSVLEQVCDEPLRIYIGDDASTDGTEAVCRRFAGQDKRIVYIRQPHNKGLVDNTLDLYRRILADGCDYIAMLDGDDYWIDPHKLQLQIDYMRTHPECGFVHTGVYVDKNGQRIPEHTDDIPMGDIRRQYNREGAKHNNCTVLFRAHLLQTDELETIRQQHFRVLDYPLYGVFSQRTQFAFLPELTTVWRLHTSVSHPESASAFIRYHYHYARCWRWLHTRYPDTIRYSLVEASFWLLGKAVYALLHALRQRLNF